MELDLEEVRRTVWSVKDRVQFFQKMRPLLTQIDQFEAEEIQLQLAGGAIEYLEIATILPPSAGEDPDAILVFTEDEVFWDIVNPASFARVIKIIEQLSCPDARHTETRRLTEEDWLARLETMMSIEAES
jgi:hypothetical protein